MFRLKFRTEFIGRNGKQQILRFKKMTKIVDLTSESDLGKFFINLNQQLKHGEVFYGLINFNRHKISKTEFIGTLVHAGFDILDEKETGNRLKFSLKKVGPAGTIEAIKQAKSILFKQPRIGQQGKIIKVFKLRTMYPMAHKAYEYVVRKQPFGLYGKITDDFRITRIGKFLRKYWIDELPQLINIFKGEMRLVGLRPLAEGFFRTLPPALQQERIKHLPALMAAVYADRPKNLEERIQSEFRYLEAYHQHPFLTDIKYFFRIIWSIIFRGQRGY